ncbi:hypothetical protein Hanom_Chr00s069253g01788131 [Helianthus anomalus]
MQAFSCLATLPASALVIACPATNPWSLSPTRGTHLSNQHRVFPSFPSKNKNVSGP